MIQEFMVYEITDKTALADKLAEAQKIIEEKGLGFETEDSTDRELFEAAVQAGAVNENALTAADDIEQAAARLTAALEAQTEPERRKSMLSRQEQLTERRSQFRRRAKQEKQ